MPKISFGTIMNQFESEPIGALFWYDLGYLHGVLIMKIFDEACLFALTASIKDHYRIKKIGEYPTSLPGNNELNCWE